MSDRNRPKVAVLVESQYIPSELADYERVFGELGIDVEFFSRLWDQHSLEFVSEVENKNETPKTIEVDKAVERFFLDENDPKRLHLEDYDAVIAAANYTSVRLRYFTDKEDSRSTPAVQLFAKAMSDRRMIKGALCHGLWLATPRPENLVGRKVTCHEVVEADIINSGADIVREPVVVDGDLVTGKTYNEASKMAKAIAEQIRLVRSGADLPWNSKGPLFSIDGIPTKPRRILVLLSEWGYWGEELVGPVEVFDAAGYQVDFMTPTGKRPISIAVSMDENYIDPPLGRSVTSKEMAKKAASWDDPNTPQGKRLENPLNLSALIPAAPYRSAAQFIRREERFFDALEESLALIERYDGLLIVGGSGPIIDLANNERVHELILGFVRADKPVAAECYGVAALAFARDVNDRKSLIWGKRVTGHCKEYDYKDGTGFMKSRGEFHPINIGPPPYPLEYILRDATGPDGAFVGNVGKPTSVIVDFPFITGRSTPDSYLTGQKLVEVLDAGLKRWGW